jgi:hypothetical protein
MLDLLGSFHSTIGVLPSTVLVLLEAFATESTNLLNFNTFYIRYDLLVLSNC